MLKVACKISYELVLFLESRMTFYFLDQCNGIVCFCVTFFLCRFLLFEKRGVRKVILLIVILLQQFPAKSSNIHYKDLVFFIF